MKLYYHPASTTCRAVMLGAAEMGITLDYQLVDLMTGEHLKPDYAAVNPNCLVPCLEDWCQHNGAVWAVYPPARHVAPKVRSFIDFLVDRFADPPWGDVL